ncbi:hypothetical protein [Sphingosinicella sp. YJ22]|uniref:hypothetical protein n=1 Tax=Sphingosinicella sp. YJ22 TaxID=1104780 RepID=UPI001409D278|nr:hypothetical protein [Sphingosinicella sp. YJ22]
MARPFNRRQARENAAFLRLLAETGNVMLAARECGLRTQTLYARRTTHAAFAAEWDAALTAAQAAMRADPARAARAGKGRWPDSPNAPARFKTGGGEPAVTRLKDGRLQLRRAKAGGIGFRGEQAFLRALATCGNISMAAQAVGVAATNIYARRGRNPVFKAEMDKALEVATERLEAALMERALASQCSDGADDLWLEEALGPLPAMTFEQAIMLLELHGRRQALGDEFGRYATRKRRGPLSSAEIQTERRIWFTLEKERRALDLVRRERAALRADEYEATGNWFLPGEEVPDALRVRGKGRKRG